ncbi:MAG: TMEM43 family protein [Myxococcales bacterium]|nr:TMEM43 family protein [Myxococcales bacterium]
MSLVEVTNTSWLSRLFGSIKSVLFGLLLALISVPLLFWNEGRAVHTARSLEEGAGTVISVPAETVDPGNEGKLVHVSGEATTDEVLSDGPFGVKRQALKLKRKVEMYQWREHRKTKTKKKLGGGKKKITKYTYDRGWESHVVNSVNFKQSGHDNPTTMEFEDKTVAAQKVKLGGFSLTPAHIGELGDGEHLAIGDAAEGTAEVPQKAHNGGIFVGDDPVHPRIGDLRIRFSALMPGPVSIIGVQKGSTFAEWQAPSGDSLLMVTSGNKPASEMFAHAQAVNTGLTWGLRFAGFFCMFIGVGLIFRPIAVLGDVVPFVGSVLQAGVTLFSFLISGAVSSVIIAVAWIVYRPLLGVALLLVAGAAVFALVKVARKNKVAA